MSWRLRAHSQSVYNLNRHQATTETRAGPSEALGRGMDRPGAVNGSKFVVEWARSEGLVPGEWAPVGSQDRSPPGGRRYPGCPDLPRGCCNPPLEGGSPPLGRADRAVLRSPTRERLGQFPDGPDSHPGWAPCRVASLYACARSPARACATRGGARGRIMRVEGPTRSARPLHRRRVPRACACPSACARA